MLKKLASFTTLLMLASVIVGIAPTQAQYPVCSDVQGGNVTFLICQSYTIDHFWSGSKIRVNNQDGASADVAITNDYNNGYQNHLALYLNSPQAVNVDNRNGQEISLTLTYLGQDNLDSNRALIKIDSNTTYEDSFYTPQPQPAPQPAPQPEPQPQPTSTLQAPVGVSVSGLYGNDPAKPLFNATWNKLPGAEKFDLAVEKKNSVGSYESFFSFTDYVADLNTPGFVGVVLPEKGEFKLRVRGVSNSLGLGPWSEYVSLVNLDPASPQPEPQSLATPVITSPSQNQSFNQDQISFAWIAVDGASGYDYTIDYWQDYNGWLNPIGKIVYSNNLANVNLSYYLNYQGNTSFRIRVRAVDNSFNYSGWSDYVYFGIYNTTSSPNPNAVQLAVPTITFPINNSKIYHDKSDYFYYGHDIAERQLNTTWNSVSGADSYVIDYEQKDGQGQWVGYYQFTAYGTYDWLYGWIDTGEYRVRLKSHDSASINTDSDWSAWTYFTIYDHGSKTSTSTTGVDGTYVGYKNLTITHTPTGVTTTLVAYDHAVVYLSLTGADSSLIYVKKGSSYYTISQDGAKLLRFYFDKIDANGVTLRLETKNLVSPT